VQALLVTEEIVCINTVSDLSLFFFVWRDYWFCPENTEVKIKKKAIFR